MPTYEYLCPACGVVEALQSMKDAPLTTCPQCGKEAVTKLVSRGAGVIFKGSGFWETDYNRGSDYRSKAKGDGGKAADAGTAKTGSDPAPAPKPEPKAAPAAPAPKPAGGGKTT